MSKLSENQVICITGTIGAGKSSVSKIIKEYGFPLLDLDEVVKQLYQEPKHCRAINRLLFDEDGEQLDLLRIANTIFQNQKLRIALESYLYPHVYLEMQNFIQDKKIVFVEMALVFEKQWDQYFNEIICVVTTQELAISRLIKYRQLQLADIQQRLNNQMDPLVKQSLADYVIENNDDLISLKNKVIKYLKERSLL